MNIDIVCQLLTQILRQDLQTVYSSENPGVFTDARCYMDWIAGQYNMRLPSDYVASSCSEQRIVNPTLTKNTDFGVGTGDINDIEKDDCQALFDYYYTEEETSFKNCSDFPKLQLEAPVNEADCGDHGCTPSCRYVDNFHQECKAETIKGCFEDSLVHVKNGTCAFNQTIDGVEEKTWDSCRLEGSEGFSYNIYVCQDKRGKIGTCANNCRGVSPNSILIGGVAPFFAAAVSAQTFLQPVLLGAAGIGAIGAGAGGASVFLNNQQCPNTRPCRVSYHLPMMCQLPPSPQSFRPQRPCTTNPGRRVCCRLVGRGGRAQCPRRCPC